MQIENLTHPGFDPVDGDLMRYVYQSGALEEKHYWTPVITDPTQPPVRRLTKLAYMNRFTDLELEGIYSAAKVSVAVEVWLAKFNATTPDADGTAIDLDDPRTIDGLSDMEAATLIGVGRAAEILT